MRRATEDGRARSVQARLVSHAHALGTDPNLVLTRFALERFLYRLSRSPYADRFVVKGALLILAWLGETVRPTRDADLLGFGDLSTEALGRILTEVCGLGVEADAMVYSAESLQIKPIRSDDPYGGRRATLQAHLGPARLRVQLDIGIGDAVIPTPEWLELPTLLDLPSPRLRSYHPETVIAEKVHAIIVLGSKNSRIKDFFDINALAQHRSFDGQRLAEALRATFARRDTLLPGTDDLEQARQLGHSRDKAAQWRAFLKRNGLSSAPESFAQVTNQIVSFIEPVATIARNGDRNRLSWLPGGPWSRAG